MRVTPRVSPTPHNKRPARGHVRRRALDEVDEFLIWCCEDCFWSAYHEDYSTWWPPESVEAALRSCFAEVFSRSPPLRVPLMTARTEDAPAASSPTDDVPKALFDHVDTMLGVARRASDEHAARWEALRPSLVAARVRFDRATGGRFEGTSAALFAKLFAPFWVRAVEAWEPPPEGTPDGLLGSLVAHLFVRYPVPGALRRVWVDASAADLKWVCWYILFAQGGSLRRAARDFGWAIPSGFVERFARAPDGLDPPAACRYAEVMRLGGEVTDFERLQRDEGWRVDPTERSSGLLSQGWEAFERGRDDVTEVRACWYDAVPWLARHREALTDGEAAAILAWFLHAVTERRRWAGDPLPSWRSVRPQEVLDALAQQRLWALRLGGPQAPWRARGWDWTTEDGWEVVELVSVTELAAEGAAMQHCVGGYGPRCGAGLSAIFSLRFEGERRATVELDPRGAHLIQVRGRMNAAVDDAVHGLVARWLAGVRAQFEGTPRR